MATKKLPVVYMQNSGLGNAINPLLSLCDKVVYSIPMLIFIGWRGEPGVQDEPQHIKQGKIQIELLKTLGIPYKIILKNETNIDEKINQCVKISIQENVPFVILFKKVTFKQYKSNFSNRNNNFPRREDCLEIILDKLPPSSVLLQPQVKHQERFLKLEKIKKNPHFKAFVGSMGHCSSIALGIAMSKPDRKIICIDGDGSLIMMKFSTIGKVLPKNLYHILIILMNLWVVKKLQQDSLI